MEYSINTKPKLEKEIHLENVWEKAVNEQFAVAIWRLPRELTYHFLADISGKPNNTCIDFENQISGFCFSPFINNDNANTLLLKKDLYYTFDPNCLLANSENCTLSEKLFLEKTDYPIQNEPKNHLASTKVDMSKKSQAKFESIVEIAKSNIEKNIFQKVVLSRRKEATFGENFSIIEVFQKLAANYPNAFISAIYLPKNDCIWLGASPELLVSLDAYGIFKTMSLAGTQSAIEAGGQKILPHNARWSQKEIEEQAFVSRYIIECFKKVRVREYIENGPKTVTAGNLLHLQTDYIVDTNAIEFKQFATALLSLLHPTSAVCGMPKNSALEFILENEGYDREYYCGYLGPVNISNSSNIFVNLRTVKIMGKLAYFYAGAGITEDSDPEKEWLETEMKMETLFSKII